MNKRIHIIYLIIILGFITAWFFENQISVPEQTAPADTTNFIETVDGQPFMALMHLQKLLVEQGWYDASGETTMTIKSDGEPHEIYIAWGG